MEDSHPGLAQIAMGALGALLILLEFAGHRGAPRLDAALVSVIIITRRGNRVRSRNEVA